MEAKELRLGNLIKYNEEIVEVIKIFEAHLEVHSDIFQFWTDELEDFNGIQLTEEMLIKVGFEVKPLSLGLTLDRFRFIWKEEYKYWYVVDAYSQSYLTKIEFVHELQNFVFAMNSQELNVSKLTKHE